MLHACTSHKHCCTLACTYPNFLDGMTPSYNACLQGDYKVAALLLLVCSSSVPRDHVPIHVSRFAWFQTVPSCTRFSSLVHGFMFV